MSRLISDVKNLTTDEKKKIRKITKTKTTNDLLMKVKSIIDLGVNRKTQEKRANRYLAEEYNRSILNERRKQKIENEKNRILQRQKKNMKKVLWNYKFETITVGKKRANPFLPLNEWEV